MASPNPRLVFRYSPSPSKSSPPSAKAPRRAKRPSPEKAVLASTTYFRSPPPLPWSATTDDSPTKQTKSSSTSMTLVKDAEFTTNLSILDPARTQAIRSSKHILLTKELRHNGLPGGPEDGDWSEVASLFPTTFAVEVSTPYLIIRLQDVPPYPWPLTVGGLPVWFTTSETAMPMDPGSPGQGKRIMNELHLREVAHVSYATLKDVINWLINNLSTAVFDVYWWADFWTVTVGNDAQLKDMPFRIGDRPAYYKHEKDSSQGKPSVLCQKTPIGVEYDNTCYDLGEHALLRPGIMLASSQWGTQATNDQGHFSTTSGVLVTDAHGQQFVTAASHGFNKDLEVWHPSPTGGRQIGRVVENLSDTDISIVELRPGLRYTNTTFGTIDEPDAVVFEGFSSGDFPEVRQGDLVSMDNPFSGRADGQVVATGAQITDVPGKFIRHEWVIFENGHEAVDGSCGCPIWDEKNNVVGFFRFQDKEGEEGLPGTQGDRRRCNAVMASCLPEHGYKLIKGQHTFTG